MTLRNAFADLSTEATLALVKARTDNLDVALSTRTKPADQQHAIIDSSALPAGAATEAKQDTGNTALVNILTELGQKTEPADAQTVNDKFTGGQALADQNGAGAALTFTFASPVQLLWVRTDGGNGRADPFGGTPTASAGIVCEDGVPNPLTITTSSVKVFASVGTTVHVWGYRY